MCLLSGRIGVEDRLTCGVGRGEGNLERVLQFLHFYGSRKASRNTNYSVYLFAPHVEANRLVSSEKRLFVGDNVSQKHKSSNQGNN